MKQTRFLFTTLAIFALLFTYGSLAQAQATRTWVSGVGDDANPCSRTAPCKTFAGAISKTATAGEINVLDPGGFGVVTITKSITIQADGVTGGILFAGTNGVIVNTASANDVVVLKGLDFEGVNTGLNGIRFIQQGTLVVEDCIFRNGAQKGIDFEPTGAGQLLVRNSTFVNFGTVNGGAIFIKPGAAGSAKATLRDVRMERNLNGVRAEDRSTVMVMDSAATENNNNGFFAFSAGGPVEMSIESSVASANGLFGIQANGSGAIVRISNVNITQNGITPGGAGLSFQASGQIISYGNNHNAGNVGGLNGAPSSTLSPGTI